MYTFNENGVSAFWLVLAYKLTDPTQKDQTINNFIRFARFSRNE